MNAIDYVVRDSGGAVDRGAISGARRGGRIRLSDEQEVSINLQQGDIRGYSRDGDDLVIVLTDGREITLDNYFNDSGIANRLFLSSEGNLSEVAFVETADGELFGQYGPSEQWGKWSPSDDLIFLGRTEIAGSTDADSVAMLGPGTIGLPGAVGAGVAGVGGVAGISGGGGGDDPVIDPWVDNAESVTNVGGPGGAPEFEVTGGGQPGGTVTVVVGDEVITTEIGEDGTFGVVFVGESFPDDGTHQAIVTVVDPDGRETEIDGPTFVIDTDPPLVEVQTGTVSVGDSFDGDEFADGVVLTGVGEPGAALEITIEDVTRTTTVGEDGGWVLVWEYGTLPVGEYQSDVAITSTDDHGNTWTGTDAIHVDTVSEVTIDTPGFAGDGVATADEVEAGVTLTGTADPGATVAVTLGEDVDTVTAADDGTWAVTYDDMPGGEHTPTATATATDEIGNTATATGAVAVDTIVQPFTMDPVPASDTGYVNYDNTFSTFSVTGTVEPGSRVDVYFGTGLYSTTDTADGTWAIDIPPKDIPRGEQSAPLTAVARDPLGNSATLTQTIVIDTEPNPLALNGPIEGDDVINMEESSDGVMLSGTSVAGAVINVTMDGVTHTAVTGDDGSWQAFFAAREITSGTHTPTISLLSTDSAGNVASLDDTVRVDTEVENFALTDDAVEGDSVVSGAEFADGIDVTGTVEIGSTVLVILGDVQIDAAVDAAGNWSATLPADLLESGEYGDTITVVATDPAGNSESITESLYVDTEVNRLNVNQNFINDLLSSDGEITGAEIAVGVNLGGRVEPGSVVVVDLDGSSFDAAVSPGGVWSVTLPPSAFATGAYMADLTVTATDAVGNTQQVTQALPVNAGGGEAAATASLLQEGAEFSSAGAEPASGGAAEPRPFDALGGAADTPMPDGSDLVVADINNGPDSASVFLALDDDLISGSPHVSGTGSSSATETSLISDTTPPLEDPPVI